jgi:hypothetical protein
MDSISPYELMSFLMEDSIHTLPSAGGGGLVCFVSIEKIQGGMSN